VSDELKQWLWSIAGIVFFLIYFGYGPYERHRLRLKQSKVPDDLDGIMRGLPEAWRLISYKWRGDNWVAELGFGERRFYVATDYGYPDPIVVEEHIDEVPPILSPSTTYKYRTSGGSPQQICEKLAELKRMEK
jgi:hypothetical protein